MDNTLLIATFFVAVLLLAFTRSANGSFRIANLFWAGVAWAVVRNAERIVERAMKTPYQHLPTYMNRYWLFNPDGDEDNPVRWLPSIRVHHILRRDLDRHLHDHPWNARTIVLEGWYWEKRLVDGATVEMLRSAGDTAPIRFGEFHAITQVPEGGVWTLFITFGRIGDWGFLVKGVKVPWRAYKERFPDGPWA